MAQLSRRHVVEQMFLYSAVTANLFFFSERERERKRGRERTWSGRGAEEHPDREFSTAVISSVMRHYKLQMLCQNSSSGEPWQRDEHIHTERERERKCPR